MINKLFKTLFILIILLILLLSTLLLFLFSNSGNSMAKPYLKAQIEKEIKQPVEVKFFKLRHDNMELNLSINHALNINVISSFSLLEQSFKGKYRLFANQFLYEKIRLSDANIHGNFEGVIEKIAVDGEGTLLESPLAYSFDVIHQELENIVATMGALNIEKALKLAQQPPLAKGKMDISLKIATLKKHQEKGTAKVLFSQLWLNEKLLKRLYKVDVLKKTLFKGAIHASLEQSLIRLGVDLNSHLGKIALKNILFDMKKKHLSSLYHIDIKNLHQLHTLTKQKLRGSLILDGNITKTKKLKLFGETNSLKGKIAYQLLGDRLNAKMHAVPIENILYLLGYAKVIKADVTGKVLYDTRLKKGAIDLSLNHFQIAPNQITKTLTKLLKKDPSRIIFKTTTLEGKIDKDELHYTLLAKGSHATISIKNALVNQAKNSHSASFIFTYEGYSIGGKISGSIKNPNFSIDAQSLLSDEIKVKAKKELNRVWEKKGKSFLKKFGF